MVELRFKDDYNTPEQKEELKKLHTLFTKKNSQSVYTPAKNAQARSKSPFSPVNPESKTMYEKAKDKIQPGKR